MLGQLLATAGNAIVNTALGGLMRKRQDEQNVKNMQLQKEMWDYTNFENQVEHMKNAGLNVGMMYANGGQSATTGSTSSNVGTVGQINLDPMTLSNIKLNEAMANKANAEADSTRGLEGTTGEAQIQDLKASVKNKEAQTELNKTENNLKGLEYDFQFATYEERQAKIYHEMQQVKKQNYILDSQGKITKEEAENIENIVALKIMNLVADKDLKTAQKDKVVEETNVIFKDYLLKARQTNINERQQLQNQTRDQLELKLKEQGLSQQETQMWLSTFTNLITTKGANDYKTTNYIENYNRN